MSDYYKVLGIPEEAEASEIKKSFRKLSLEFHPDRNKDPSAQAKCQEINEAYEILGDPEKRKDYDMKKKMGGFPGPGGGGFPGGGFPGGFPFGNGGIRLHHGGGMPPDMNNIFEQFFGAHMGGGGNMHFFHNGRPMQPQKPPPLEKHIPISLQKSYEGFHLSLDIETPSGKEKVDLLVPQGVNHNECVVVSEKGHWNGDMKGDLHIYFDIEPHDFFKRDGLDLICKKTISLKEALCGFLLEIPHINGKMLRMTNHFHNVVKPGFKREIPGLGMTRGDQIGKMIIEFDISFPDAITDEQKIILDEVLK